MTLYFLRGTLRCDGFAAAALGFGRRRCGDFTDAILREPARSTRFTSRLATATSFLVNNSMVPTPTGSGAFGEA